MQQSIISLIHQSLDDIMVKREIAEELARIACAGHDNRLTR